MEQPVARRKDDFNTHGLLEAGKKPDSSKGSTRFSYEALAPILVNVLMEFLIYSIMIY